MKKLNCIWVLILLIGSGCASSGDISGGIIDEVTTEKVGLEQIQTDVNKCRVEIGLPPILISEADTEHSWAEAVGIDTESNKNLSKAREMIDTAEVIAVLVPLPADVVFYPALLSLLLTADLDPEDERGFTKFKLKHCLEQKGYGPNSESDDKASQQAFTVVDKRAPLYLRYLAECNSAPRAGLYRKKFKSEGEVFGDCASGVWVIEESIVDRVEYEQDFVKCYELAERSEVTLKGSYLSKQRELYHLSRARDNLLFSCLANRHYEVGGPYLKQD